MPAPDNQNFSDARIVSGILVTTCLICALAVGTLIGSDDPLFLILGFGAAAVMAALVLLQTNIWILIPMFWYLTGRIGFAPLPFSVRDITVLLAFGGFAILYAMRAIRGHVKQELLDWLVFPGWLSGNRFPFGTRPAFPRCVTSWEGGLISIR